MKPTATLITTKTFHTIGKVEDQNYNFNVHVKESTMVDVETNELKRVRFARLFNSTYTYDMVFMNLDVLEREINHLRKFGVATR